MTIDENQLIVWTHSPGSTRAQNTYAQVKKALESSEVLKGKYDIFLQGSYANSTNIRIDSDIDIVVQMNSAWMRDISKLNITQQQLYLSSVSTAKYTLSQFRADVIKALKDYFGSNDVKEGKKSIKLTKNDYRVAADVVPCIEYRDYEFYISSDVQNHTKGIKFFSSEGIPIINYPKLHLQHGEEKNHTSRTNDKYKHVVRILKNVRRILADNNKLDPNIARSYFVECAVYNVPDLFFVGTHQQVLISLVNYLLYNCRADSFRAANHKQLLFGSEVWQWNKDDAALFFKAVESFLT